MTGEAPPETELQLLMQGVALADPEDPQRELVAGIDWEVHAGDFWIIGGFENTGKSELLHTAIGLQKPLKGRMEVFGQDTSQSKGDALIHARLRMGIVFDEEGRLFQRLTLRDNVCLGALYHHHGSREELDERAEALLKMVGAVGHAGKLPGSLPPTIQRRVALARALMMRPRLLLLDKPLRGLDPREHRWWIDTLTALNEGHPMLEQEPLTLVVTTNELRHWRNRAGHFAVIQKKKWRCVGPSDALFESLDPELQELLPSEFVSD